MEIVLYSKMKKKSQFKIQETAFVLLAVIILFGLIFLFFARFELGKITSTSRELREDRAILRVRAVASMPELRCSESYSKISEVLCLDRDKVKAFNDSSTLRGAYKKVWDGAYVTEIIVQELVPENKVYWVYKSTGGNESYYSFIPLCSRDKCSVARLIVGIKID